MQFLWLAFLFCSVHGHSTEETGGHALYEVRLRTFVNLDGLDEEGGHCRKGDCVMDARICAKHFATVHDYDHWKEAKSKTGVNAYDICEQLNTYKSDHIHSGPSWAPSHGHYSYILSHSNETMKIHRNNWIPNGLFALEVQIDHVYNMSRDDEIYKVYVPVATFRQEVKAQQISMGGKGKMYFIGGVHNVTFKGNPKNQLRFDVIANCAPFFYSCSCTKFCHGTKRYHCDSDSGEKICNPGFYNAKSLCTTECHETADTKCSELGKPVCVHSHTMIDDVCVKKRCSQQQWCKNGERCVNTDEIDYYTGAYYKCVS